MIKLEPEILNVNGTMKVRILARDGDNKIIDADVVTVESSTARKRLVTRLAEKSGEAPEAIEQMLLDLLNVAFRPPPPQPSSETLLAEMPDEVKTQATSRLKDPDLVGWIKSDIKALGVSGDEHVALGVFLIGTSRLLDRPLAGIARGASSSGKSYIIDTTGKMFPPEVKLLAHHISAKALYYLPDDALVHRFVVGGERARRHDDEAADATKPLREMISDGVLRAAVTEIVDGRPQTFTYEKPGPIAYIESTSAATIFSEDANRCLIFHVDESESQTRQIISAAARSAARAVDDADKIVLPVHHAMQRMLRPYRVVVPFAPMLAEHFPTRRVEARRAMPHLLNTIKSVALLRQYQKTIREGVIDADADDYAVALEVMRPTLANLRGDADEHVKRVWRAIQEHIHGEEQFTREQAAGWAGVRQGDANGRLRILAELGFIVETQEHKGNRPAKFKVGSDAGDIEGAGEGPDLPTSDEVRKSCV